MLNLKPQTYLYVNSVTKEDDCGVLGDSERNGENAG